jgi:ATPase
MIKEAKVTLDTSVLIDKITSELLKSGELEVKEIVVPIAAVEELQHQANTGRDTGFFGLDEIKTLQRICSENNITLKFAGRRPTPDEIRMAKLGAIDYLIIDVAKSENSALFTSDRVMYEVSTALGIKTYYFGKLPSPKEKLRFEEFFDPQTASVHIKEGTTVKRKKGFPGNWILEDVGISLSRREIEELINEILVSARLRDDGFIEISRENSYIVQLGTYRIVIVEPPASDGYEITIVKPLKKLSLNDYKIDSKLLKRLEEKAEGIVVAGRPGSGKTTFVQALAEWYLSKGKVVKTLESPRDLNVSEDITQYSKNFTTSEEIHDILLLARPDYVVFDEMRDTPDFELYKDLRLAGVGMVGVVHAERPIDAIQRFIPRTELGLIPQIVDTVIFIENGEISQVYELSLVVKVPTGMFMEDLARPVVEVRDLFTGELKYELYTFGEEIVVVPVSEQVKEPSPIEKLAAKLIEREIKHLLKISDVKVEILSDNLVAVYVPERARSKLIGKKGRRIEKLERLFGLRIRVKSLEEKETFAGEEIPYELEDEGKYLVFYVDPRFSRRNVSIYIEDKLIMVATVSKKGKIRILKNSDVGRIIQTAIQLGKSIKLILS